MKRGGIRLPRFPMLALTHAILTATVFGQLLLLVVLLRRSRALAERVFAIYVAAVLIWTLCILLNLSLQSLFVEQCLFAAAALGFTAQYWFAKLFPTNTRPQHRWEYWSLAVGAFFIGVSFWPGALFTFVTVSPLGYTLHDNGPLATAYSLFVLVFGIAPIITFVRKRAQTAERAIRAQLSYLAIGFALFLVVSILTNSVLPAFFHIYTFNAIGPVFSLVLAVAVFYIIWRHQFLNIRVLIERGIIYLFFASLITGSYFGALSLLAQYHITPGAATPFIAFTFILVGGFAIYGIERSFERSELLAQERTHAIALEKTVAERTAHLEDLQAYQRRMTSDIAHAFQTPLTVLTSAIESLMSTDLSEEKLVSAKESTDRLSRLMYALLHLSRLEALPVENHQPFSLSDTLAATLEYTGTICSERGIILRRHIAPKVVISGDPGQIEELLTNLLSNAIRHTQDAHKKEITVSLTRNEKTAQVVIYDRGTGIAPEALPHVFERFYRAPENTEPGTGLGLAIAKRIVELHGGSITAESQLGKGATFTVTIPLHPVSG